MKDSMVRQWIWRAIFGNCSETIQVSSVKFLIFLEINKYEVFNRRLP